MYYDFKVKVPDEKGKIYTTYTRELFTSIMSMTGYTSPIRNTTYLSALP